MSKRIAEVPEGIHLQNREAAAAVGYFFVGGQYEKADDRVEGIGKIEENHILRGQMYVEVHVPVNISKKYPMVFIPGNNQTALSWIVTPDGRKGWASYFLEQGYVVYLIDPPYRGRSSCLMEAAQKEFQFSAERCEHMFAGKNGSTDTKWPGGREMNTEEFDFFYATVAPSLTDNRKMQTDTQIALGQLLDQIGPAILVVHSQAGPFGWLAADARPGYVKALLQLEPKGPPLVREPTRLWEYAKWGLTEIPMTYDPPAAHSQEIEICPYSSGEPGMRDGFLQKEPARKLSNLMELPMLLITGSVSYHSKYDYLTVLFLRQAGVKDLTHINLEDCGILGNAHMMMLEENSLQIAERALWWLNERGM